MKAPFRATAHGRLDRAIEYSFIFNGRTLTGHPGDTLASALLAHGVHQISTSIKLGRPRGITAAWAEDTGGLIQIDKPFPEPMLLASTVELFDGLVAHGLPGQGRLAEAPDPATYDSMHAHADVLVIGSGPAGLASALIAARAGARVILIDEHSEAGGSLLGSTETIDGSDALDWVASAVAELAANPDVRHLQRTTAFGHFDDGFVLALERRTDHLGLDAPPTISRQRVWRLRARHIVIATGAHERPIVFADNDRPGILLAQSARTFLHRYGVKAGNDVVVFTTNDTAYSAAMDLHDAGAHVRAIIEARSEVPPYWASEARKRAIHVEAGSVVSGTSGDERITQVRSQPIDEDSEQRYSEYACDALLVSGGWNPAVHLFSQARGELTYDESLGAFVPGSALPGTSVIGSANGVFALVDCLCSAQDTTMDIVRDLGFAAPSPLQVAAEASPPTVPALVLWRVRDEGRGKTQFVDLQRDATVFDLERAVGAGLRSVEHVKRYTTIGTAHDQGKTSGVISSAITAELLNAPIEALGVTTFRPPYTPVAFAALAGRNRGSLYDPERLSPVHDWHKGHDAVFEDAGQWKRPSHYPLPGEDQDAAVYRECVAVRTNVALFDGSMLGKIDVQGPDAGVFLDLIYTNLMSSLPVGRVRYGLMCGVDGMVIDDGTVMRLADERFQLSTTSGGAARVYDWLEEWLQTEWPHLRVRLTSVTDQWATFAVAGPNARAVIERVFADVDVSNDAFPFMAWVDTELDAVPVRLARISFSGELAYEVYVNRWHAPAIWERLLSGGREFDMGPYGLEAVHVLRAEKGFPIVGQDTDGTVTPHDLGMEWAVSKKKSDFLGKRSFRRVANQAPDRKQLVGLRPLDLLTLLPEGSQLIEHLPSGVLPPPPVRMLGHVTSSYRSAELGHPFALALLKGGRARIGEVLSVPVQDRLVSVEVTDPVFVDPEGARRDG